MKELALLIISYIGVCLLYTAGFIISIFLILFFQGGWAGLKTYFFIVAKATDKHAGAFLYPILNLTMLVTTKGNVLLFGNSDHTISYVIAINYYHNNLSKFGLFWYHFLEKVDPGHAIKSIEEEHKQSATYHHYGKRK